MPFYKVDFLFSGGGGGWSESWWTNQANLGTAAVNLQTAITTRSQMLASSCSILALRLTDTTTPRSGRVFQINTQPRLLPRDTTFNAILARVQAGGDYHRTMTLRGVPDDWIQYDGAGIEVLADAFRNQMNGFIAAAANKNLALCFRALDKGAGANPRVPITGFTVAVPTAQIIVTAPGHNLNTGDFCTIGGCKGANLQMLPPETRTINGIWKVSPRIDANTFGLPVTAGLFPGVPVLFTNGWVKTRTITYPQLRDWQFLKFSRRLAGKAFFVRPGHRPAIRRR